MKRSNYVNPQTQQTEFITNHIMGASQGIWYSPGNSGSGIGGGTN